MKRILLSLFVAFGVIYAIEATNILGLHSYRPTLEAAIVDHEYVLTWAKSPYPSYYDVEVFKSPQAELNAPTERVMMYRTWNNKITINQSLPANTYCRVSAHGLFFQPLGEYSDPLYLTEIHGDNSIIKPEPTSNYPLSAPASDKPILTWKSVPGAVYYEFELLSAPPENPNGIEPSTYQLSASKEVFTNGYNIDLSQYQSSYIYWRVRALNYDGNPLGVFSDAQKVYIDHSKIEPLKPTINVDFDKDGPALYPVYSWIPIAHAVKYEVEVLDELPENPHGIAPSSHRIWSSKTTGFDCYDDEPRLTPGIYYWRVRGLDEADKPVGVFSDASKFIISPPQNLYAATFGDSITHGGGAVSYSPANPEYNYQTYLDFSTFNLGRSGDTSKTMLERFNQDVMPYHPKYLIILGGSNSLRGGVPAAKVIAELTAIRDKCLARGIRPIFLTLPPINPASIKKVFNEETAPDWRIEFARVNAFIRQQRYFIDIAPYLTDSNGELPVELAVDGLHPDIPGKQLIAQAINASWARVTQ
ncbi:MAG: hypothetical protein H6Q73_1947 [Firmicutes bacterium]|nr:hypothetical protein [Bacillota bacterium]